MSSLDTAPATASPAASAASTASPWSTLVPARVQKITVDDAESGRWVLELFAGGKRCLQVRPGRIDLVAERAARDGSTQPPTLQGVLRKELVPSILSAVEHDETRGLLRLVFVRKDLPGRTVIIESDGRAPRWVLVGGDDERILAAEPSARPDDGRDTRRGRPYEPPRRAPAPPIADDVGAAVVATPRGDPRLVQLRQRLRAEHERLKRLQKALRHDLEKHGDPDMLELRGELLKMMMGRLPRGTDGVEIVDFEGVTHAIPLDPAKDAKGNLAALFARARRARAGRTHTAPRVQATEERLSAVAALRARLQQDPVDVANDPAVADAEAFLRAPETGPSARRRAATSGTRQPWRSFMVSDGVVVRVGRGARDNDALVKSARGHDLWLHARDRTGAHAVIPSTGGVVADDVLLDAAHLAAWFSMGRQERNIDIQYTRVKHLRKPGAGAPAGLFLVANETVLHLRVDEARTKRLLAAEIAAG